ncbi:hypothetical protein PSHT_07445 [Puccinia striiformis]|uniref:Uncharacterized protein n=1 Tax=Puccinia striiformis TaxID=27350 RepID=A0A2S4VXZ3_9BASI|nr:hypothetical protein PSHT_07445 [Puccinia striiformis]
MELDGKDLVLETKTLKMPLFVGNGGSSLTGGAMPDTFSLDLVLRKRKIHTSNPLEIDLQELHAFQHFQKLGEKRFFEMTNLSTNHRFNVLSIIKAYCRAHNKLVLRARLGSEHSSNSINPSRQVSRRKAQSDLYSPAALMNLTRSRMSSQEGTLTYLGLIEIRAGRNGVLEGIEDFLNNDYEYNNHQEVIHPGWIGKLTIEIQVSSADKLDHLILSRFNKSRLVDFLSPALITRQRKLDVRCSRK